MSATNRGTKKEDNEFYETPEWCVLRFLEEYSKKNIDATRFFEPCVGAGAIIRATNKFFGIVNSNEIWTGVDIVEHEGIRELCDFTLSDILKYEPKSEHMCITNPPYTMAFDIAQHLVGKCASVAMLLRLNWCSSEKRQIWLEKNTPSLYVLPNRPSFVNGKTDATDYGWVVWDGYNPTVRILKSTPLEERKIPVDYSEHPMIECLTKK